MNAQRTLLNGGRAWSVGVAVLAVVGCGRDAAADESATALLTSAGASLICAQVDPGRAANRQIVSASIDATGALVNVAVLRGPSRRLEHLAATSSVVPGYQNGYYEQAYHLLAWNIGSEGENDYFLLLPDGGTLTGTFTAQLHLYFLHGDAGWWQKVLSCTVQ